VVAGGPARGISPPSIPGPSVPVDIIQYGASPHLRIDQPNIVA